MKIKLISLAAFIAALSLANGAVTFSIANYTSSSNGPNGLVIVGASGAAVPDGTAFAAIGTFAIVPNWATATASSLSSTFNFADATSVAFNTVRPGLFNGQDYNSATNIYSTGTKGTGLVGTTGYIFVGNNANLALSTAVAIFTSGTNFTAPDGANNAIYTISLTSATSSLMFGTLTPMNTTAVGGITAGQPNTASTTPFVNGVQLVAANAVPEPSAVLLGAIGALGLLRRRRN